MGNIANKIEVYVRFKMRKVQTNTTESKNLGR